MKKYNKLNKNFSVDHLNYLKKQRTETGIVWFLRFALLFLILGMWELFANVGVIDSFISSSPSRIVKTLKDLFIENNFIHHIGVTLLETLIGFIIAVCGGTLIALLLWWSERARRTLEPYIVVLNSLPKIALGPIIIVWFGTGMKSIIFMTVIIGIIVTIITMLNGFLATDKDKISMMKTMGANKFQILIKLVVPNSLPTFVSMLKINVGMAWIGSIMGEYLVSRAGLGYLIVYGGQVFKLDLVMAATVTLCVLATVMYCLVVLCEKLLIKYDGH